MFNDGKIEKQKVAFEDIIMISELWKEGRVEGKTRECRRGGGRGQKKGRREGRK